MPVDILKDKIKSNITCPAFDLQLFLAKNRDGTWLRAAESDLASVVLDDDGSPVGLVEMQPWLKNPTYFGENFQPAEGQVHVFRSRERNLWLVTGSIGNAFNTVGIRSTLYHLAAMHIGYYLRSRPSEAENSAFWYQDKSLCIHVLFKTEERASEFENALRDGPVMPRSPLYGQKVMVSMDELLSADLLSPIRT